MQGGRAVVGEEAPLLLWPLGALPHPTRSSHHLAGPAASPGADHLHCACLEVPRAVKAKEASARSPQGPTPGPFFQGQRWPQRPSPAQ